MSLIMFLLLLVFIRIRISCFTKFKIHGKVWTYFPVSKIPSETVSSIYNNVRFQLTGEIDFGAARWSSSILHHNLVSPESHFYAFFFVYEGFHDIKEPEVTWYIKTWYLKHETSNQGLIFFLSYLWTIIVSTIFPLGFCRILGLQFAKKAPKLLKLPKFHGSMDFSCSKCTKGQVTLLSVT